MINSDDLKVEQNKEKVSLVVVMNLLQSLIPPQGFIPPRWMRAFSTMDELYSFLPNGIYCIDGIIYLQIKDDGIFNSQMKFY